jgi:hypothetical protein
MCCRIEPAASNPQSLMYGSPAQGGRRGERREKDYREGGTISREVASRQGGEATGGRCHDLSRRWEEGPLFEYAALGHLVSGRTEKRTRSRHI